MRAANSKLPGILILLGFLSCTPMEHPVEQPPVGQLHSEKVGSRLRAKIEADRGLSQFS